MRKYVYLFTIGGEIVHSSETEESLMARPNNPDDKHSVQYFIQQNKKGNYLKLSTGEYVFQTEQ